MTCPMQNTHGKPAFEFSGVLREVQVLQSAAGFYIGTADPDGCPSTRESEEYWRNRRKADKALNSGNWTQKMEP